MVQLNRLSAMDLTNLALEAPDAQMHQLAFGVLDGAGLVDARGHVRIDRVRRHVEARLDRVPELRRKLYQPGWLGGRALWVDDPDFRVEDHVLAARLPEPGGAAELMAFAEQQMSVLMDRSRPMWQVWFLEGCSADTAGIVIKLHHALADGPAMVNVVGQIFDLEPGPFDQTHLGWKPSPPPSRGALIRDNLAGKASWVWRAGRALSHPIALARSAAGLYRGARETIRVGRHAPRTSLNRPIGITRRVAAVSVPLFEVKALAHATGVKVNDVFLAVIAESLRKALLRRGETIDGAPLRASVAVSLRHPGDAATSGNRIGTMVVPLRLDDDGPLERLAAIASASARAKATQRAVLTPGLMLLMARLGVTRAYIRRQRLINLLTTNLPGPPMPLYFAGSRLVDAIAIPPIAGNVTASFAALSYGARLELSVVADAESWPDLDLLADAMRSTWLRLKAALARERRTSDRESIGLSS